MSKLSVILAVTAAVGGTFLGSAAQAKSSFVGTSTGDFGKVNTETGDFEKIGNTGNSFYDIEVMNDTIGYGVTGEGVLFSIDPSNATTQKLGSLNRFVNGLGFDNAGNLFGTGAGDFFKIDLDTVSTNLLATIDGFTSSGDLAYDGSKFFVTSHSGMQDTLFSVNPDGTDVAQIGDIGFVDVYGLTYQDNTLLGFNAANQVIEINPMTGAGQQISMLSGVTGEVLGASPAVPNLAAVPEPSMAIALVGLGIAGYRKRQQG